MGELVPAVTAYLTPLESEAVALVLRTSHELDLDHQQFTAVAAFARAPCPRLPLATQEEFKPLIRALAGTLKSPRTSLDEGRLKLSMYWAALRDLELFRVRGAAEHFIKTEEWMPTPGQLRKVALQLGHPVLTAHARAVRLVRERAQRLHVEVQRRIRDRELDQAELDRLTEAERRAACQAGHLVPTPEGLAVYPSREAVERWRAHLLAQFEKGTADE